MQAELSLRQAVKASQWPEHNRSTGATRTYENGAARHGTKDGTVDDTHRRTAGAQTLKSVKTAPKGSHLRQRVKENIAARPR